MGVDKYSGKGGLINGFILSRPHIQLKQYSSSITQLEHVLS